jgi:hypothetical protein
MGRHQATGSGTRAGNGEGTIFKTKDGRHRAAISLENGTRKWLSAPTEAEVRRKLKAARRARDQGLLISTSRQRLDDYLVDWIESKRLRQDEGIRASTAEAYRLHRARIKPFLGHVRLDSLKTAEIRACYSKLQSGEKDEDSDTWRRSPLAARTVLGVHRMLRKALQDALCDELIPSNVANRSCKVRDVLASDANQFSSHFGRHAGSTFLQKWSRV